MAVFVESLDHKLAAYRKLSLCLSSVGTITINVHNVTSDWTSDTQHKKKKKKKKTGHELSHFKPSFTTFSIHKRQSPAHWV